VDTPGPQDEEIALEELIRREPIFHRSEFGTTRADFERMTVPDFWEIGASGRRYNREYVLDELERRYSSPGADEWTTSDFDAVAWHTTFTCLPTFSFRMEAASRAARRSGSERMLTGRSFFIRARL
jgi:hypothetical protein